jgi:hypothetical protein
MVVVFLMLGISGTAICQEEYSNPRLNDYLTALVHRGSAVGYPSTLDQLSRITSPESLVVLTNYYLGAGGGEVLGELITKEGKSILPLLKRELQQPVKCLPKYRSRCIDNVESKRKDLTDYINAIKRGVVLCPDLSDCPSPKD